MTTTELIEELKRFGPYAKVIISDKHGESSEFNISHLKPQSECRIETDFGNPDLQEEIKDLEEENGNLTKRLEKISEVCDAA